MKRVLLISPEPLQAYQGGVGVYLDSIINRFNGAGYYFDIIHYANEAGAVMSGRNFTSYRFPAPPLAAFLNSEYGRSYMRELLDFLNDNRITPDILHVIDVNPLHSQLKSALGVPSVFDLHLSTRQAPDTFLWYNYDAYNRTEPPRAEIEKAFWQREVECMEDADILLVHSRYYGRLCDRHRSRLIVIPNGIDLEAWQHTARFELPGNRPLKAVYLGRFDFMKGVDQLLQAAIPPEVDLIFYGTTAGRYATLVRAHAAEREEIHYGGALYGQDKVNMLGSADALICPSRHEPFGIVALEALASRCLTLTSFAGGLGEIIPVGTGIDCGTDQRSMGSALASFASMSREEKNRRINEGSLVPPRFDWDVAAGRLESIYAHLLS